MSDNKRYRPVFFRKVRGSLFLFPIEHAFHPVLVFNLYSICLGGLG
jgi:hypothetical protein